MLKLKLYNSIVYQNAKLFVEWMGDLLILKVSQLNSGTDNLNPTSDVLFINMETKLCIKEEKKSTKHTDVVNFNFEQQTEQFIENLNKEFGGYSESVQTLMKNLDFIFSDKYSSILHIPRCFAVWGLEGTGKTTLKNKLAAEYDKRGVKVFDYNGAEIWAMIERGQALDLEYQILNDTNKQFKGSLICIDDFELIAGKELIENEDNLLVHQSFSILHQLLDNINQNISQRMALIIFTRNVDAIDSSFRVHGRLDKEIYLPVPGTKQRQNIIKTHLLKIPLDKDQDQKMLIDKLNALTPGFVGKDIERLFRMAMFHALSTNNYVRKSEDNKLSVSWNDFEYALRVVRPSQISDLGVSVPSLPWDQFAGYEEVKRRCLEIMYWPLEHPEAFERHGLPTCSGMLLYGPSGCGKTLLVKCLASLKKMNYISIKCPEIFSKYTGETEQVIRDIFKKAKQLEPCVLVFDELDALASNRELDEGSVSDSGASTRALSQLLNEMDGIQSRRNVFLIGCTNRKEMIDPAILRPGRLDQLIELPLPTYLDRVHILKVLQKYGQVNGNPMPMDNQVLDKLDDYAKCLNGATGADLCSICREAALEALREDKHATFIRQTHMEKAIAMFLANKD
jgi:SpoVK/Ycf46/Vps4 family AAA+-type ATPase